MGEQVEGLAKVALVGVGSVDAAVEQAIEMVGGLTGLKPGMTVLIKPNVNSNDSYPATSNPETVAALVKYVARYNPKRIIVADASNSSFLPTIRSMKTVGIYQAATEAGAEVIGFEEEKWVHVAPEGAVNWRQFKMPQLLLDADYVISQCVVKAHFKAVYSMALKNWMGVADFRSRYAVHVSAHSVFYKRLAELNLARPADFVLLDGITPMVSGGPFSGEVVAANIMVATANITAADAVGLAILKYLGTEERIQNLSVWSQPVLRHGIEIGLGVSSADEIELLSENFEDAHIIQEILAG